MPVTAKLSKAFYDKVGEQAANELADWFNSVDATYRADLERINALNFARFEAKLDQRVAELRADVRTEISGLRVEQRFAELKAELIKWMFVFWCGSALVGYLTR